MTKRDAKIYERDRTRFEEAADEFAARLHKFGLRPLTWTIEELPNKEGFWASVVGWPAQDGKQDPGRPEICIFLDHGIMSKRRLFWFGFSAKTLRIVKTLAEELSCPIPVAYYREFSHTRTYFERVRRQRGLSLESIDRSEHYFGKYLMAFGDHDNADPAAFGARFVMDTIDIVDPSFAERLHTEPGGNGDDRPTEQERLKRVRIGQRSFRAGLDRMWRDRCAVTGCTTRVVLRASHIKPWSRCTDKGGERLDPHNGLLLTANLDALFDQRLITFDDDGRIIIASQLKEKHWPALGLSRELRLQKRPLSAAQKRYLKFHRALFRTRPSLVSPD